MNTDALVAGRPIHQPIPTNAQIDEAFDTITYGKGGHVVAMIAGYMGDERFRDGVRRYMAAHMYGSATSTQFFAAMAEAAGAGALLVDPHQPSAIREAVVALCDKPDLRAGLIDRGFENLKRYQPRAVAAA